MGASLVPLGASCQSPIVRLEARRWDEAELVSDGNNDGMLCRSQLHPCILGDWLEPGDGFAESEAEGRDEQRGAVEAKRLDARGAWPEAALALGLEPGGAQRASLAIVVIGGLLSSLVLTLFIVPIMYNWIAPKELRHGVVFADERKDEPPPRGGPAPQPA